MPTTEQLQAIRRSAPHNTKLTVSRPARLKRKPPKDTYHGTGNVSALLLAQFPKNHPTRKNKKLLSGLLEMVYRYAEQENNGIIPCPVQIKRIIENAPR